MTPGSFSNILHKEQRLLEIVPNRIAVPAVVEPAEVTQEIFDLRVLGLVPEGVVLDGLCPSNIVNADHERFDILNMWTVLTFA